MTEVDGQLDAGSAVAWDAVKEMTLGVAVGERIHRNTIRVMAQREFKERALRTKN